MNRRARGLGNIIVGFDVSALASLISFRKQGVGNLITKVGPAASSDISQRVTLLPFLAGKRPWSPCQIDSQGAEAN